MRRFEDRPAPKPKTPDEVDCPKCGQEVETEVLWGRRRKITTTKIHVKPGPTAVVCYAILKTEEK